MPACRSSMTAPGSCATASGRCERRRRHLARRGRPDRAAAGELEPDARDGQADRRQQRLARLLGLYPRNRALAGEARDGGGRVRRQRHGRATTRRSRRPVRHRRCALHPARDVARRRQHRRRGRDHGLRLPPPGLPTHRTPVVVATAQSLREQVACACRILALEGYADLTLGHVSARATGSGTVHIKRKGVGLDETEPEDVISFELDDENALDSPEMHLEAVLHTEVYRLRPDVGAVVHGHPPHATSLSATGASLELLTHDAVLFVDGLPVYDETAELITQTDQGRAVAAALGNRNAVLLRNHGVLAVGRDVPWAVLVACTLERAVRLQAVASTLGELRPIDEELARQMYPAKYHDGLVEEYWQAWLRKLEHQAQEAPPNP